MYDLFFLQVQLYHITTIFLTQQYSQEQDLKNGAIPGQIGPRVPSGLIFKDQSLFSKYLLTFSFARYKYVSPKKTINVSHKQKRLCILSKLFKQLKNYIQKLANLSTFQSWGKRQREFSNTLDQKEQEKEKVFCVLCKWECFWNMAGNSGKMWQM